MPQQNDCEFYSPDQLASVLGFSTQTIYRRIHSGLIKASKGPGTNGAWRIHRDEVDRLRKADGAAELKV